jgi:MerR family mercuric resistance operon transcriptional regulator
MPALAPATIAGLAKSAGVDVETIRSYERMGLLPKPRRRAIALGFTLEAIGELLGLSGGLRTCGDVYLVAERQLSEIRQRIAELSRIEAALAPIVANCPRSGPARDCPLVIALSRPE